MTSTDHRPSLLIFLGETGDGKTEMLLGRPLPRPKSRGTKAEAVEEVEEVDQEDHEAMIGLVPRTIRMPLLYDEGAVRVLAIELYKNKVSNVVGHPDGSHQCAQLELRKSTCCWHYPSSAPDKGYSDTPEFWRLNGATDLHQWLHLLKKNRRQADTTGGTEAGSQGNKMSSRSHLIVACFPYEQSENAGSVFMLDLPGNEDFDNRSGHASETNDIHASLGEFVAFLASMHYISVGNPRAQGKAWTIWRTHFKNSDKTLIESLRKIVDVPHVLKPRVVVLGMAANEEKHQNRAVQTLKRLQRLTL
jgi:hypothetical protein